MFVFNSSFKKNSWLGISKIKIRQTCVNVVLELRFVNKTLATLRGILFNLSALEKRNVSCCIILQFVLSQKTPRENASLLHCSGFIQGQRKVKSLVGGSANWPSLVWLLDMSTIPYLYSGKFRRQGGGSPGRCNASAEDRERCCVLRRMPDGREAAHAQGTAERGDARLWARERN